MHEHADRTRADHADDKPPLLIAGAFLSASTGIRFVCEDLTEGLSARGWPVITTSNIPGRGLRLADMLGTTWIKRRRYAVAQIDVYSGSAFIWAEAVGASLDALRCPYVLTLHSGSFPEFAARWPRRVHRLLQSATAVTSPSPFLQKQLREYRADITVIHNGLHLKRHGARPLTAPRPKLVWVRAFEQRYNPVLALQVVARLVDEYPNIELLMVGPDRADWSAQQTLEEARRLGLGTRVRVIGAVSKEAVPYILQQGDIFLNTTNVDNAPVTVVEALASGLCVVSTDAGGIPDLVENESEALVVPRADPEAMAAATRRILSDPDLAARLSMGGLRKAELFAWDTVLSQWEELLLNVAGSKH